LLFLIFIRLIKSFFWGSGFLPALFTKKFGCVQGEVRKVQEIVHNGTFPNFSQLQRRTQANFAAFANIVLLLELILK